MTIALSELVADSLLSFVGLGHKEVEGSILPCKIDDKMGSAIYAVNGIPMLLKQREFATSVGPMENPSLNSEASSQPATNGYKQDESVVFTGARRMSLSWGMMLFCPCG